MPRVLIYTITVLVVLSWVPFAFIARARATKSELPRVHIIQDMDLQPKVLPQSHSDALFADNRGMRPRIEGTVAWDELRIDDHFYRGIVIEDGAEVWATEFPEEITITERLVLHGKQRYDIFCATCHGLSGNGNGPVNVRAMEIEAPAWIPPTDLHSQQVLDREVGHLYNSIKNGIRSMPAYASQIPPADRWAIVAYVRALQYSWQVDVGTLPQETQDRIRDRSQ